MRRLDLAAEYLDYLKKQATKLRDSTLMRYLIAVAIVIVLSAALFVYLWDAAGQRGRQDVNTEAMKVLVQLVAISVIGGFLTWTLTEHSKEKERQDRLNEFRRSADTRIVTATNVVRQAPVVMQAYRSKQTYGEQMRAVLNAKQDLSAVRHDLRAFQVFTNSPNIETAIEVMEKYLDGIVNEWIEHYNNLPEGPTEAWDEIKAFSKLKDLLVLGSPAQLGEQDSDYYKKYMDRGYWVALELMRREIFSPLT